MTKTRPRQLELPVMVDVNGKPQVDIAERKSLASVARSNDAGFHKPASAEDRSVYKAISDNYFSATAKHA